MTSDHDATQRPVSTSSGSGPGSTQAQPAEAPSLLRRFCALMIDWILVALISLEFVADPRTDPLPAMLIFVASYAFFVGLFTQTPGMWAARLRCVSIDGGGRIGLIRAALRGLLRYLVVPVVIMNGERRGLHDRLVRSVIIPA